MKNNWVISFYKPIYVICTGRKEKKVNGDKDSNSFLEKESINVGR